MEILTQEYINLLEIKLEKLVSTKNNLFAFGQQSEYMEMCSEIKELKGHIEDLKMELSDGMSNWRDTQN